MTRLTQVTVIDEKSERVRVHLVAQIGEEGDLVLDGCDLGPLVEEQWGDSDYEYTLTVPAEYRDTVLLLLVKERFENDSQFREWLTEREIPSKFWSWA